MFGFEDDDESEAKDEAECDGGTVVLWFIMQRVRVRMLDEDDSEGEDAGVAPRCGRRHRRQHLSPIVF